MPPTSAHPTSAHIGPDAGAAGFAAPARDADALAEPVAAAVLACPGVAELSAGPFGTVGTYLPGRRVPGVQITETMVTIRVIARPVPVYTLEAQVRAAVATLVPGLPVDLAVDDLALDPEVDPFRPAGGL